MEAEREFQDLGIPQMESILDRYDWSEELAGRLLVELAARRDNSPAARELRGRLMSCSSVGRFESPDKSTHAEESREESVEPGRRVHLSLLAGEVATIRPVGTPNLPLPQPSTLNSDFKLPVAPNAPRSTQYRVALEEYIKEMRESGPGKRRNVRNGVRTSSSGRPHWYKFEISDAHDIPLGDEVDLLIDDLSIKGTILSTAASEVSLELESDAGIKIPKAQLRLDDTKLLERLRERIGDIEGGKIEFNTVLADAAVGAGRASRVEPIPEREPVASLNPSQLAAQRHVLNHALTFIWGPPGCGKTLTLGEVVRSAFDAGKRMLICSNTNKAVDQVLYSICKALGKEHPAMQGGQVVRLGVIADPKLAKEYGDSVNVDSIVERLAAALRVRLDALRTRIAAMEREDARVAGVLQRFAELAAAQVRLDEAVAAKQAFQEECIRLKEQLVGIDERMIALADRLHRRSHWTHIFGRSVEELTEDLDAARAKRTQMESLQHDRLQAEADAARCEAAARSECAQIEGSVAGEDRAACETKHRELTESLAALRKEREAIDKEISELKMRVMREARIIGATGTRVFLTPKEMGLLDLVIVDEVSMLLQPVVWVVAGLSRERVVLCGDFRQLSPICSSSRSAIFDLVGRDVFDAAGVSTLGSQDERMVMLDTQYRMDAAICALISTRMYDGKLRTATDPQWRNKRAERARPPPPLDGTLTLIDTSALRSFQSFENRSRFNLTHALLVRNLVYHLTQQGFAKEANAVAVCTPYKAHARLIAQVLKEESLEHVQVGTAHAFQGDECNAVILDFPESHGHGIGHFLKGMEPQDTGSRLTNVSVSRAQNHLIVMANLQQLDAWLPSNAILRGVLCDMQRDGRVLPATALLAVGPRGRDLEGLEGIELDDPARRFGAFNSQTFDRAFAEDVARARKSIAIFSGFVSRHRVGELKAMLRNAVQDNVKVRCVSRPPRKNFDRDPASGAEAFAALESIGCVVDGRARVHEKTVIIDARILWHGSLNVLSFSQLTDELMTRTVSVEAARTVALLLAKRAVAPDKVLEVVADRENSRCAQCGSRTFYDDDRYATFFSCENECGWREVLSQSRGAGGKRGRRNAAAPAKRDSEGRSTEDWEEYLKTAVRPYLDQGPPCPTCEYPTRLKWNRLQEKYFYGCSRFQSHRGRRGSVDIPAESTRR